jgi:hypothetical protein
MKISGAVAVLAIAMVASLIGTPHLLYEYKCQGYDIRHCVYYTVVHTSARRDGVNFTPRLCRMRWVAGR